MEWNFYNEMEIDEEKLGFEFQDAKLMKKHVGDQI